jgi:acyl-CoA synthetase (AMP-forming)/AMP-acid ligase II
MNGLPLHTLQDIWANVVDKFPNKTAVICEGQAHTYREIDAIIGRVGQALRGRFGLAKGERIAVAMPNSLEFFVAYWATVLSGGAIVPINTRLRAEEMEYVIENADARALVVHRQVWAAVEPALARRAHQPLITVDFEQEGQATWAEALRGDESR